jgi:hypothetical protein
LLTGTSIDRTKLAFDLRDHVYDRLAHGHVGADGGGEPARGVDYFDDLCCLLCALAIVDGDGGSGIGCRPSRVTPHVICRARVALEVTVPLRSFEEPDRGQALRIQGARRRPAVPGAN